MDKVVGVIGGGSWATAIVKILTENVPHLNWYMRNEQAIENIKKYRRNPRYLQSVELNTERIYVSSDIQDIIKKSDIILLVTPSAFLMDLFKDFPVELFKGKTVFSSIKGIIPEYHAIPARFIHKSFGIPYDKIGMICGPCHAEEVAMERLSYLTIVCQDEDIAENIAKKFSTRYINTQISDDLFGTELSVILKNIYAIAAGICAGLGYGDNFQAVLIANAIQEIENFIDEVSPIHRDVKSSAYLGDLLVTAYSKFSRNRTFGFMIGKGYSVKIAQMEMDMIAEGYYAVKSIMEINKRFEVEIPIVEAVYNIIYERISPVIEMKILSDKLN
ncbi:MAG: NAD(P)H-dependent glycerol-3-phosphate dehydrogenase [Brumimicrobium sp.]